MIESFHMELFSVYRTTNVITGHFYLGYHKSKDPYDSYLGSGSQLRIEIEKYGISNFRKEVLFIFETSDEAFKKEEHLIQECLGQDLCLNLHPGGKGGWRKGFKRTEENKEKLRKPKSEETKAKMRKPKSDEARKNMRGRILSESTREKMKKSALEREARRTEPRHVSDITRRKLSEASKGHTLSDEVKRRISEKKIGHVVTEETKAKLRGRVYTDEERLKISLAGKGRKLTEETCKKMSEAKRGSVFTEEHKRKLSEARRAFWKRKKS